MVERNAPNGPFPTRQCRCRTSRLRLCMLVVGASTFHSTRSRYVVEARMRRLNEFWIAARHDWTPFMRRQDCRFGDQIGHKLASFHAGACVRIASTEDVRSRAHWLRRRRRLSRRRLLGGPRSVRERRGRLADEHRAQRDVSVGNLANIACRAVAKPSHWPTSGSSAPSALLRTRHSSARAGISL
jgi:hypothetical protein